MSPRIAIAMLLGRGTKSIRRALLVIGTFPERTPPRALIEEMSMAPLLVALYLFT
jgi:hypothetical protein